MATPLKRPVARRTNHELDGSFGKDRNRALVITIIPGTGSVPDTLELRPLGTRRGERIALCDVYRLAIRGRVNRELLEKARATKVKKAAQRVSRSLDRMARKLVKPL